MEQLTPQEKEAAARKKEYFRLAYDLQYSHNNLWEFWESEIDKIVANRDARIVELRQLLGRMASEPDLYYLDDDFKKAVDTAALTSGDGEPK